MYSDPWEPVGSSCNTPVVPGGPRLIAGEVQRGGLYQLHWRTWPCVGVEVVGDVVVG